MRAAPLLLLLAISACAHDPVRENIRSLPQPTSERRAFLELNGGKAHAAVTVMTDGGISWSTRWQMLDGAEHRIDASYFIVDDDVFGLAFLAHLYERAQHGVTVRLLVDGRGTLPLLSSGRDAPLLEELAAAGDVEVRVYNPLLDEIPSSLVNGSAVMVAASSHHKILAVDDACAIAGGRNIGDEYFLNGDEKSDALEDADILLDGPAAAIELARVASFPDHAQVVPASSQQARRDLLSMLYTAMDAWMEGAVASVPVDDAVTALELKAVAALDHVPDRAARDQLHGELRGLVAAQSVWGTVPVAALPSYDAEVRVVASESRAEGVVDSDDANDAMLRAIAAAKKSIVLETPYFLMTPRMLTALERAGQRGVHIDVLTNSPLSTDNPESQALFIDSWPELEARIPTLRFFVEADHRMLHGKRALFDDELSFVGSYNIDPLSAHLDSEIIIAVWSRDVNAFNRGDIDVRIDRGDVLEYRIVRDAEGRATRYPDGHPLAGQVVVAFGPRDHLSAEQVAELETLKSLLVGVRGIWDFQWVVW